MPDLSSVYFYAKLDENDVQSGSKHERRSTERPFQRVRFGQSIHFYGHLIFRRRSIKEDTQEGR